MDTEGEQEQDAAAGKRWVYVREQDDIGGRVQDAAPI